MNTSNVFNKHLTLSKRIQIEQGLNEGKSFIEIGEIISKSPNTVYKEVRNNRQLIKCNRWNNYNSNYNVNCSKTKPLASVCNSCESKRGCRKNRYYYYAEDAQKNYLHKLSSSRVGIDLTSEEFNFLNKTVSTEIKQGHSFSMIINNHKGQFAVGKRTLYNYVEKGYLDIINFDLPKKVTYKKRTKHKPPKNTKIRVGRTYEDFLKEINLNHYLNIIQMDTVEGNKGGSVLLTLLFTYDNFMLAFKLKNRNSLNVLEAFDYLKDLFGYELFYKLFPVILTDNGPEFSDPDSLEYNGPNIPKTKIYYCDPGHSEQKGSLENNHRYIRKFVPKGISFDDYSQDDINLMINHINSVPREKLEGNTPFDIRSNYCSGLFFKLLNLKSINRTDVILHKRLFKQKDTK
jgi:transposase, IS30 family